MPDITALPASATPLRKRRCTTCKENFFCRDRAVTECQNCSGTHDPSGQANKDAELAHAIKSSRKTATPQVSSTPGLPAKPAGSKK